MPRYRSFLGLVSLILTVVVLSCDAPTGLVDNPAQTSIPSPAGFTASSSFDGVLLAWEAVPKAKAYRVYRSSTLSDTPVRLAEVTSLSYTDTTATSTLHYYQVAAVVGSAEGFLTAPASGYLGALPAPTDLAVTGTLDGASLTWSEVPHADHYNVWSAPTSYGTATLLASVTTPSYLDETLVSTGFYAVSAVAPNGNPGDLTIRQSATRQIPGVPTGLAASVAAGPSSRLTWAEVPGATSYEVWRHTSSSTSGAVKVGTTTELFYGDDSSNLVTGSYYYWVKAVHGVSPKVVTTSPWSSALNTWILGKAPVVAATDDGPRIGVTWSLPGAPATITAQLQRSQGPSGPFSAVGTPVPASLGSVSDTTADVGILYYYRILLLRDGFESVPGEVGAASFATLSGSVKGLVASVGTSKTAISLGWTSLGALADSYNVYSSVTSEGPFTLLDSVTTNSYADAQTGYQARWYKVAAVRGGTEGSPSSVAAGETFGRTPMAPTATKAGSYTYPAIKVTWTAVPGAQRYVIRFYDVIYGATAYVIGSGGYVTGTTATVNLGSSLPSGTIGSYAFTVTGVFTGAGTPGVTDYTPEGPRGNFANGY